MVPPVVGDSGGSAFIKEGGGTRERLSPHATTAFGCVRDAVRGWDDKVVVVRIDRPTEGSTVRIYISTNIGRRIG